MTDPASKARQLAAAADERWAGLATQTREAHGRLDAAGVGRVDHEGTWLSLADRIDALASGAVPRGFEQLVHDVREMLQANYPESLFGADEPAMPGPRFVQALYEALALLPSDLDEAA